MSRRDGSLDRIGLSDAPPLPKPQGPRSSNFNILQNIEVKKLDDDVKPDIVPQLSMRQESGNESYESDTTSPSKTSRPNSALLSDKIKLELEVAGKQGAKTAQLIRKLQDEIATYNEKDNLSTEQAERLMESQDRLEQYVQEFTFLTEKAKTLALRQSHDNAESSLGSVSSTAPSTIVSPVSNDSSRLSVASTDRLAATNVVAVEVARSSNVFDINNLAPVVLDPAREQYQLQMHLLRQVNENEVLQKIVDTKQTELNLLKKENELLAQKLGDENEKNPIKKDMNKEVTWIENEISRLKSELSQLHTEREELLLARQMARAALLENNGQLRMIEKLAQAARAGLLDPFVGIVGEEIATGGPFLDGAADIKKDAVVGPVDAVLPSTRFASSQCALDEDPILPENLLKMLKENVDSAASKEHTDFLVAAIKEKDVIIHQLRKEKEEAAEEVNKTKTTLEYVGTQANEFQEKFMKAQEKVDELKTNFEEKKLELEAYKKNAEEEISVVKKQAEKRMEETAEMRKMLDETKNKLEETAEKKRDTEKTVQDLKADIVKLKENNVALGMTIDKGQNAILLGQRDRERLAGEIKYLQDKYDNLHKENAKLKKKNEELKEDLAKEKKEKEDVIELVNKMKIEMEKMKNDHEREISAVRDSAEATRSALQTSAALMEKEATMARIIEKRAVKERREMEEKYGALKEYLSDSQGKWTQLQESLKKIQKVLPGTNLS